MLKEPLVTEEYRPGLRSWHLERVEKHIAQADSHIERQSSIDDGQMQDLEPPQANLSPENYSELHDLLEEFGSLPSHLGTGLRHDLVLKLA
jgi:hypothetical protein